MLRRLLYLLSYTGVCHTPERDSNPCKSLATTPLPQPLLNTPISRRCKAL